ncbi:hypothetical protein LCGC14_0613820 [marine sediment metagenome]|uniref:Uncharacterized protein n=1 Tax=marine sediment metagenome TaxID=412755 RepID=A0A0F9RR52_9ZZZZ
MITDVIKGLLIFERYIEDLNAAWISAEHDLIYAPDLDRRVSEEDGKRLDSLGWFYMDDVWQKHV